MKRLQHVLLGLGAVCAALSIAAPAMAQPSEYRIAPGETLEINISSVPDHNLRAVVQTDGTISIAEAGSIMVAGLTPAQLQARLEMVLPTKLFRVKAQDGKEQTFIIGPQDISSSVAAYLPVYVTGDVLSPGEQVYHPLMTARQAVAVTGGYSQVRLQAGAPAARGGPDPLDLQRDYQSLWTDYLKEHFHRERIRAQMDTQAGFDVRAPAGSPLPAELAASIAASEQQALKITMQDNQEEKAHLEAGIVAAAEQIDTLAAREKVEAAAEKADEQDLAKVSQLFKSGDGTNARVAEIRRSLLLTSTRRLSTLVELMRVRGQRTDYERQLEKNDNLRKIELLNDLNDTSIRLAGIEVKLRAAGAKLQVPEVVTSVEPSAAQTLRHQMVIVRKAGDEWRKLPAGNDSELLPGDVLEIGLCVESAQGSEGCPASQADGAGEVEAGRTYSMN
jgi:polysaccharide biosynthesis/export protein